MTRPCPGPPPLGRPKLKLPAGAVDTHMHIFGPFDAYPLAENRSYTCPPSTLADYRNLMTALGVERCVIVHGSANGTRLAVTTDALAALGDRGRGVGVVDANVTDDDFARMNDAGYRAIRLTTYLRGGLSFDHLEPMAARIKRFGWHIQVFTSTAAELAEIAPRLKALPVDVLVDHMGHVKPGDGLDHPGFRALLDLLATGRCWTKLSAQYRFTKTGPPYADMVPFAKALIKARPDRLMWATDWPHVMCWDFPMPRGEDLVDWISEWGVDAPTLRKILVENPSRLFWGR